MSSAETPQARARAALALLCDAHAARGGHLYVLRDGVLALVASLGTEAPTDELRPLLDDIWQQQVGAADMPTTFAPAGVPAAPSNTSLLTDARGATFQPVADSVRDRRGERCSPVSSR